MSTSRITPSPSNFILNSLHSEIRCVFFGHCHDLQGFVMAPGWRIPNSPNLFLLSNGWQARCGCLRTSGTAVLGNKGKAHQKLNLEVVFQLEIVNNTYISYVLMLCWYYYDEWTTLLPALLAHFSLSVYFYFHLSGSSSLDSSDPQTHTHNKKHQHMWKSSNTTTVQH